MTDTQTADMADTGAPPAGVNVDGVDLSDVNLFAPEAEGQAEEPAVTEETAIEAAEDALEAAPVEEKKPEPKPEPKKSEEFLRMARLERQLREERAARQKFEEQLKAAAAEDINEDNALELLAKRGITLQKLAEQAIRGKTPPAPKSEAEKRAEELEKQVLELRKEAEERKKSEADAKHRDAIAHYQNDLKSKLVADVDAFPFCAADPDEAVENIWAAAQAHMQQTGEAPDLLQVAEKWEAYERERFEKRQAALTARGTKGKISSVAPSHQQTASRTPASGPKTLTNRAAASSAPARKTPLTEDERMAEAAADLKNFLRG